MKKLIAHLIIGLAFLCDAINPLKAGRLRLANARINRTVITGVRSLKFAREGVSDTGEEPAVTVGEAHCPDADATVFESLGDVENGSVENTEDGITIVNASSGQYRKRKTIPLRQDIMLKFKMQTVNQLTHEMLWLLLGQAAGAEITVGTQYQPMKKAVSVRGWLELKISDQTATNIQLLYLFCNLRVKSYQMAEKEYTHELEVEVLDNTLNKFELDALTAN